MTDSGNPEFDWADGDVVVPEQAAIAVYVNLTGDVVVRQHGAWNDDDDSWIWFSPEHAHAIANAILDVAGYGATAPVPKPAQVGGKPKDPTAAGRQKRYRQRQKEKPAPEPDIFDRDVTRHTVTGTVTQRDGHNGDGRAN